MVINIANNKTFCIHDSVKKNYSCYDVLTFIQACTHKNNFIQIKNVEVRIYFDKCFFNLLKINKITSRLLTCLKNLGIRGVIIYFNVCLNHIKLFKINFN